MLSKTKVRLFYDFRTRTSAKRNNSRKLHALTKLESVSITCACMCEFAIFFFSNISLTPVRMCIVTRVSKILRPSLNARRTGIVILHTRQVRSLARDRCIYYARGVRPGSDLDAIVLEDTYARTHAVGSPL